MKSENINRIISSS